MLFKHKRSQTSQILDKLKRNKKWGVYNYELNRISMRYSARIGELRNDGHNIQAIRLKGGSWKYYLND